MTYIPDVRSKKRVNYAGEPTEEDNAYWQGNLKVEEKALLTGYDWCVEALARVLCDFEDFLLSNDLDENVFDYSKVDSDKILECSCKTDNEGCITWTDFDELEDDDRKNLSKETAFMIAFQSWLFDRLEMERDEIGVSLIEGSCEEAEGTGSEQQDSDQGLLDL